MNYHIHQIYHIRPESAKIGRTLPDGLLEWGAADESLQDVPRDGRRNTSGAQVEMLN